MTAAATASVTTTNLWRVEKSIRRSIMHAGVPVPHAALRVEQGVSRHHDRCAGRKPAEDLHAPCESPARLDAARLEDPFASLDVDDLPEAGIDDRLGRHG